jgi:magnesium chelatase subunit D
MDRLTAALVVLALEPGVGGLWLRGRAGPLRDAVAAAAGGRRIHPAIGEEALSGGLDLAATLATGRRVLTAGVLEAPLLALTMAERAPRGLAARLGQWIDGGGALVALDEGTEDEALAPALADRLGLFVATDGLRQGLDLPDPVALAAARERLPFVEGGAAGAALAEASVALGIVSLRAPLQALAAARALAAYRGADLVADQDLRLAAELVFAPRALPPAEAPAAAEPPPPPDPGEGEATAPQGEALPQEMILDAVRAALPPDLLAKLAAARAARAARGGGGTGAAQAGNRRGRPLPSRAGRLDGRARIDPVATLRAAAPWQAIRRRLTPDRAGLLLRASDLRLRRFEDRSDRVLIFAVDASGSAALARLAEAKGAVELLLAQAYARRDHVALVAFRGETAEVLLPPTRSLVQTKRRLAGLPGGGGTPLAAGLKAAAEVARLARARGMTPTLALLTDGRANIGLDGQPGRARAMEEARQTARLWRGWPAVVIDTAMRPQPELAALAAEMGATCLPLPRADAARLSAALSAAMG